LAFIIEEERRAGLFESTVLRKIFGLRGSRWWGTGGNRTRRGSWWVFHTKF